MKILSNVLMSMFVSSLRWQHSYSKISTIIYSKFGEDITMGTDLIAETGSFCLLNLLMVIWEVFCIEKYS